AQPSARPSDCRGSWWCPSLAPTQPWFRGVALLVLRAWAAEDAEARLGTGCLHLRGVRRDVRVGDRVRTPRKDRARTDRVSGGGGEGSALQFLWKASSPSRGTGDHGRQPGLWQGPR